MSGYRTRKIGAPFTLEHRVYIEDSHGNVVSPFHDIPLYANEQQTVLNMIVEIPRWTNAKMEISKEEPMNPIKQDIKKGKLRYVRNCFPHHGYLWNYGAFPQTWEDPNAIHPETKAKGDNDPLDVCEIGELVATRGEIKQVKVLGVMALLDEEETDWKIIVIDVNDPLAPRLNDIEDVERHLPGLLRATNEWFRIYKIPDGKPENQFAFSGECKNKKYATDVIRECAEAWERLIIGKVQPGGISLANTSVNHSAAKEAPGSRRIKPNEELPPAPIDGIYDKWFFISESSRYISQCQFLISRPPHDFSEALINDASLPRHIVNQLGKAISLGFSVGGKRYWEEKALDVKACRLFGLRSCVNYLLVKNSAMSLILLR
ncbi:MAG: hypothetical protein LQ337_001442 [Flavoplaca oasis]|nr:MAG: hypothetical protein LQ337_001442 [Flavoplaca oasis]